MDGAEGERAPRSAVDEALKERAMDEAPLGITLTDPARPDNPLVYINDSFVEMTGYAREEVLGRNCRFLQGPESDEAAVAAMRSAIDEERPVSVELLNYRKDGSTFWNQVKIAPLRGADGTVTNFVGFQMDVTARKDAELAVERERANLDRLVERVNGLLSDVTGELVAATSRDEVETALVERLVTADPYLSAWVGRLDMGGERLQPGAAAGAADPRELAVEAADGPIATAIREGRLQVATPGDGSPAEGLAAVPLRYGETTYGALVVRADGADALDDREAVVLTALARAAATAIHAVESRRLLTADHVVELELTLADPAVVLVGLSTDREVEFAGSVPRPDGEALVFLTVRTDEPDADVVAAARDHPAVASADVLVERDAGTLLELVVDDPLLAMLAGRAARLDHAVAVEGRARIRIELPPGGDARDLVAALQERFAGTELVAYREDERPTGTRERFVDAVESRLTDKQLTALRKAYHAGYFDPSRAVTGQELAESMAISRSTFHQHLRAAERKLIGAVLGDD